MTEIANSPSNILVPIISHAQPVPSPPSTGTEPETTRHPREARLFIVPKQPSCPLPLDNRRSLRDSSKSSPFFQNFQLAHLFSKKQLTEEEIAVFASMREQDDEQYQTPPRDRNSDKPWGKFSVFDKPLPGTVASSKPDRANETKRRPKEKGLRKLSQRAYEIVLNMRSASYKEVANRLVDELNHEHELDNGEKDEQNIKRRVYDALNVLIALGVLRKEGRKIVGDRDHQLTFEQDRAIQRRREFAEKQKTVQAKSQTLADLKTKYTVYQGLSQKPQNSLETDRIRFPFLVLQNGRQGQTMGAVEERGGTKLRVSWPRSEVDSGHFDMDFLVEFNKNLAKIES